MKCVSSTFKAVLDTCFSKFDFYVVDKLGSFLLLHVLYMSITEIRIYYVKATPHTLFKHFCLLRCVLLFLHLLEDSITLISNY